MSEIDQQIDDMVNQLRPDTDPIERLAFRTQCRIALDHSKEPADHILDALTQLRARAERAEGELKELRERVFRACVDLQGGSDIEIAARKMVNTNRANQQSTIRLTEENAELRAKLSNSL